MSHPSTHSGYHVSSPQSPYGLPNLCSQPLPLVSSSTSSPSGSYPAGFGRLNGCASVLKTQSSRLIMSGGLKMR
jgi:hypothetical protein